MGAATITTYSMWSLFRNCRKACEWRYIHELVPLEQDHNLAFGTFIISTIRLISWTLRISIPNSSRPRQMVAYASCSILN